MRRREGCWMKNWSEQRKNKHRFAYAMHMTHTLVSYHTTCHSNIYIATRQTASTLEQKSTLFTSCPQQKIDEHWWRVVHWFATKRYSYTFARRATYQGVNDLEMLQRNRKGSCDITRTCLIGNDSVGLGCHTCARGPIGSHSVKAKSQKNGTTNIAGHHTTTLLHEDHVERQGTLVEV